MRKMNLLNRAALAFRYIPEEAVYDRLKSKKEITAEDFIGIECKGPWIEDFLFYCSKEDLPVDFVLSHPYPTSYSIDSDGNGSEISRPVTCTFTDILWLRKAIAHSKYANSEIQILDKEHGFALRDWQKMGSPNTPNSEQTKKLKEKVMELKTLKIIAGKDGRLNWEAIMDPWSEIVLRKIDI